MNEFELRRLRLGIYGPTIGPNLLTDWLALRDAYAASKHEPIMLTTHRGEEPLTVETMMRMVNHRWTTS